MGRHRRRARKRRKAAQRLEAHMSGIDEAHLEEFLRFGGPSQFPAAALQRGGEHRS